MGRSLQSLRQGLLTRALLGVSNMSTPELLAFIERNERIAAAYEAGPGRNSDQAERRALIAAAYRRLEGAPLDTLHRALMNLSRRCEVDGETPADTANMEILAAFIENQGAI